MVFVELSRLEHLSLELDDYERRDNATPPGDCQNREPLNYSDVVDAITSTDPSFRAMIQPQQFPYVEIIEQPVTNKFRYLCETKRSGGKIFGVNSKPDNKTYPTIKIHNYTGEILIVVSCVTKNKPYWQHPHQLIGLPTCTKGVCVIQTQIGETNEYSIKDLGIQCVKRRDIASALRERQKANIDPFKAGYDHVQTPQMIDLNAVRLCFQVFIPDKTGLCRRPLKPVLSDIMFNKYNGELKIVRSSHCTGPARGDTQVILLCEKMNNEDMVVEFYLKENNMILWETTVPTELIHKQVAIVFKTPAFKSPDTRETVTVKYRLKRLTDNVRSNSFEFEYINEKPAVKKTKDIVPLLQSYYNHGEVNVSAPAQQIKFEANDKITTPQLAQYEDKGIQWPLEEHFQPNPAVPGLSTNPFLQNIAESSYGQQLSVNPSVQPAFPPMQITSNQLVMSVTPKLQPLLPNQLQSTYMQAPSQNIPTNAHLLANMEDDRNPFSFDMQTKQIDPRLINMQTLDSFIQPPYTNMQLTSENMQPIFRNVQPKPPNIQPTSTNTPALTSNMAQFSSNTQLTSENMQLFSQNTLLISLEMDAMSTEYMMQTSPSLQEPDQNLEFGNPPPTDQQEQQLNYKEMEMDTLSSKSINELLRQCCNEDIKLNSRELAGLSSMLDDINDPDDNVLIRI